MVANTLGVLITYYNEKELLTQCLESLLSQTPRPDEIIVYDDASAAPAAAYIPQAYSFVKVIRGNVNRGVGYARNVLMQACQCDFIHFHDSDDMFHPDWSEKIREIIDTSDTDLILTEISSFKDEILQSKHVLGLARLTEWGGDLVRFGLSGSILVPATTFRRELGLKIGGYRTRDILPQSEDFDFHIRLAATGLKYEVLLKPLIIQRLRSNSLSSDKKECLTSAITSTKLLSRELAPQYRSDLAEAAVRLASTLYKLGYLDEARAGFTVAQSIYPVSYKSLSLPYRFIAQLGGPETAEKIGAIYRRLPYSFRHFVRQATNLT